METTGMKVAREIFIEKRNVLVTKLEVLSRQLEDKNGTAIARELYRLSKELEDCSSAGQDLEELCDCIHGKCCNLAAIMQEIAEQINFDKTEFDENDFHQANFSSSLKKIYAMFAMHVGRLTLDNHRMVDGYALHFVQKVNEEDSKWAHQAQRNPKLYEPLDAYESSSGTWSLV
ncbi:uncharacterized protein N7529_011330 [Penicillium soppii]|jgi:DNA repair ATPase RecN|uniref:uncharacterized protein n=1 Tax=Penicillium soppii TaxID=69789 RepID=UPI002548560B|nr:uncharacterized protein N7529_011330 [Penicillium soppii]KAJ5851945.1 hypothetical protein N7529_011330 [Penicillium soppii]